MQQKFITIEGTEGAGKSTALKFIQHYLEKQAIPFLITREPGGTPTAEAIRQLLLHANEETITSKTELLLLFAGRAQHIAQVILPALQEGKCVVSDRFIDASYAYQGGGREIDQQYIEWLDQFVVSDCYPSLTLLLDIPVEKGFERTLGRGSHPDRIEQEQVDFFHRVREAYLARAQAAPERIKIIDASGDIISVQSQIEKHLVNFFGKHS